MVFSAFMNQSHIHISKYYKTFIFSNNGKLLYGMYIKLRKLSILALKCTYFGQNRLKHTKLISSAGT